MEKLIPSLGKWEKLTSAVSKWLPMSSVVFQLDGLWKSDCLGLNLQCFHFLTLHYFGWATDPLQASFLLCKMELIKVFPSRVVVKIKWNNPCSTENRANIRVSVQKVLAFIVINDVNVTNSCFAPQIHQILLLVRSRFRTQGPGPALEKLTEVSQRVWLSP